MQNLFYFLDKRLRKNIKKRDGERGKQKLNETEYETEKVKQTR